MSHETEQPIRIERASRTQFIPDLFLNHPRLRKLLLRMNTHLLGDKVRQFPEGYDKLHPVEAEPLDGGAIFLMSKGKMVLVSLPPEDYGIDERKAGGNFSPTKVEHVPTQQQKDQDAYFWFMTETLQREMYSVITGGVDGSQGNAKEEMLREALEEVGLELDEHRLKQLDLPSFEVWQSTTSALFFKGSLRQLLLGNQPVAVKNILVSSKLADVKLPFRYGSYKVNVAHFFTYDLTEEEIQILENQMMRQRRDILVVSPSEALKLKLRPSTRTAIEAFVQHNNLPE
jgi:hypothetical protein